MGLGLKKEKGNWYLYVSEMEWQEWIKVWKLEIPHDPSPLGFKDMIDIIKTYYVLVRDKKNVIQILPISHVKVVRLNFRIKSFLKSHKGGN